MYKILMHYLGKNSITFFFSYFLCQAGIIYLGCPQEVRASQHNGVPIKSPLKPIDTIVLWYVRGPQLAPMMQRDASLSDSCLPVHCNFSILGVKHLIKDTIPYRMSQGSMKIHSKFPFNPFFTLLHSYITIQILPKHHTCIKLCQLGKFLWKL